MWRDLFFKPMVMQVGSSQISMDLALFALYRSTLIYCCFADSLVHSFFAGLSRYNLCDLEV